MKLTSLSERIKTETSGIEQLGLWDKVKGLYQGNIMAV